MHNRYVRLWLWLGVVMIFVQIILGGITRLTGSGLSITQWDIITGTLPPMNQADWDTEFALYRETPQYQQLNQGMTLGNFKFIYFWEYVHRLWARSIGFVFLLPFMVFLAKDWLDRKLIRDLGIAVLLGVVVATFGWIMVASGLIERPWVNAYNLTLHLNLALILYAWLFWVALGNLPVREYQATLRRLLNALTGVVIFQLILGGLMSGMKAGVYYPTWPDMYGEFFPVALLDGNLWNTRLLFTEYERGPMPGLVQFLHRITAYIIALIVGIMYYKSTTYSIKRSSKNAILVLLVIVVIQVILGVLTVINSVGSIPLSYGVAHQATAILLLSCIIFLHRKFSR